MDMYNRLQDILSEPKKEVKYTVIEKVYVNGHLTKDMFAIGSNGEIIRVNSDWVKSLGRKYR